MQTLIAFFDKQIESADCGQLNLLMMKFAQKAAYAESDELEEVWELLFATAQARLEYIAGDNLPD
eukprot:371466-Prorocentrum_lima.AAC.1